jgi:uncharacterized Zn finger protein
MECQGCGQANVPVSVVQFGEDLFALCQSCLLRLSAKLADESEGGEA